MPTVICSYCDYAGQGKDVFAMWCNAERHEKRCSQNPEVVKQ
jgi:hypothetical protein